MVSRNERKNNARPPPCEKVLPLSSVATDSSVRDVPRLVVFLTANMLFGAGLFAHAFLYNFYLDELGLGAAVMGAAAAALTAGGLIALIPAGFIIDRFGARTAYLGASLIAATGLVLGGMATGRVTLLASAVIAGAGTAAWRVGMGPLTMALAPARLRSRIFSWNVALLVGSGAAWIASAGALPAWLEQNFELAPLTAIRVVLIAGGALTGLAALAMLSIRPIAGDIPVRRSPRTLLMRGALRSPLTFAVVAVFAWMCASALVIPFFNIYFTRVHGLPLARVGVLFALAQAATAVLLIASGEAAARLGARRALTAWCILFTPALLALAFTQSLPLAIALFFIQGICAPATNPLIDEILLSSATPDRHGIISSSRNAATELSGFAAAATGGLLLEASSFRTLFTTAAIIALAGALLLLLAIARLPRATPGHATAQQAEHPVGVD